MAHAQLLGAIGEPGTLNRKQPLQIELNGRSLTLDEYEQLIRLSKQTTNHLDHPNSPEQLAPTHKTSGSNVLDNGGGGGCGIVDGGDQDNHDLHFKSDSSNHDSSHTCPRRTINTITIKTVCTSATPIGKEDTIGALPTTTTHIRKSTDSGTVLPTVHRTANATAAPVSQHVDKSNRRANGAPTTGARTTVPAVLNASHSTVTPNHVESPLGRSGQSNHDSATKHSVQVIRETLRETVHRIPVEQTDHDPTMKAATAFHPTYHTQPFRVAGARDSTPTSTSTSGQTSRPYQHNSRTRTSGQYNDIGLPTNAIDFTPATPITSRFAYGQQPNDECSSLLTAAASESSVASGHVQQQIDRLSARLQQQPHLRKSYERLVQQKHTLSTSTSSGADGTLETPQMRQVTEQQLRYADHWNQAPISEHRIERSVEKRLANGAMDRQVSRQFERNTLPPNSIDSALGQSFLSTSVDVGDPSHSASTVNGSRSRTQRVREELGSDQFVQELRTRIANGSSYSSSPSVVAQGRSATLDRKRTSNTANVAAVRSRSVDRKSSSQHKQSSQQPQTSIVTNGKDAVDRALMPNGSIAIGSPGGSLATSIVRKVTPEVTHLSNLPAGARYSYACSRNVNGWSEMDDDWIGSDRNHNLTVDSSRVSDETLNVSRRSIDLEGEPNGTYRKRDKYGFFLDQSQSQSSSSGTLQRK
jgi:hypothetical protein